MKRLKTEMEEISDEQKSIREGQQLVKEKFQEMEKECKHLREETKMIRMQGRSTQLRLALMFQILKARESNDLARATELTRFLRLVFFPSISKRLYMYMYWFKRFWSYLGSYPLLQWTDCQSEQAKLSLPKLFCRLLLSKVRTVIFNMYVSIKVEQFSFKKGSYACSVVDATCLCCLDFFGVWERSCDFALNVLKAEPFWLPISGLVDPTGWIVYGVFGMEMNFLSK